jgi:AraC-like DNA-binding protein
MYEHRYREDKMHGMPDFPFHIYRVEHQGNIHTIMPIHWHNEMEIIYLAQGAATFKIENQSYLLRAGDALIVHPGELHSGENDQGEATCYYAIVFKFSWLSSLHADRVQTQYVAPILQGEVRLPALLTAASDKHLPLLEHIRQILDRYERQSPAYEMSLKGLLLLLVSGMYQEQLVERCNPSGGRRGRDLDRQIKRVLAYMDEHAHEKLELDQLASIVSLSRSHFCKFFKNQTGMRPMEYLNYIRIVKAANLLQTGSYNVLEAALEAGYPHASYFAKWFKQYMKMTPSEYKIRFATGR